MEPASSRSMAGTTASASPAPTTVLGADRPGQRRNGETPPTRWRIVVDRPRPGAENMALDHALAEALEPGVGVLRIYGWERPTVSFGRNETARGLYDPGAADREGVGFVRRPTGGRVVLHDDEITYAVAAPVRAWGGVRAAYRSVNRGVVAALKVLGVEAGLAGPPRSREAPLSAGPCFQIPAEGEVVANGRKLVGSAQARVGGALLQHGSVLLAGSQDALARIGPEATAEAGARPATLHSLLGAIPAWAVLVHAFVEGFSRALGGEWAEGALTERERSLAAELTDRYESPEWTWRR